MKLLLEIKDDKAAFVMELLSNFNFVKSAPLGKNDASLLSEHIEAVEEVNDIKAGQKQSKSLTAFLHELKG